MTAVSVDAADDSLCADWSEASLAGEFEGDPLPAVALGAEAPLGNDAVKSAGFGWFCTGIGLAVGDDSVVLAAEVAEGLATELVAVWADEAEGIAGAGEVGRACFNSAEKSRSVSAARVWTVFRKSPAGFEIGLPAVGAGVDTGCAAVCGFRPED